MKQLIMESTPKRVKRQRSENWLKEDKIILKKLVRERVSIIENKKTDTNTNTKKVAAWNDLRIRFNNMAKIPRTLQQIKAQWGIIKMFEKRKKFNEQKKRSPTDGGPPPSSESPSGEDITVWLPREFPTDSNKFDSKNQILLEPKIEQIEIYSDNSELEEAQMMSEPSTSIQSEQHITTKAKPTIPINTSNNTKGKSLKPNEAKICCVADDCSSGSIDNTIKDNSVLQIAETEIACRKQLHEAQMANEKQKLKNLLLKEEVLKQKLEYYKNKVN